MKAIVKTGLAFIIALSFLSCEQLEEHEVYDLLLEDVSSSSDEDVDPDVEDGPK